MRPVLLVLVVIQESELGPEVITSKRSNLVSIDRHLLCIREPRSPSCNSIFFPLLGHTSLISHHIETSPGVKVRSRPYSPGTASHGLGAAQRVCCCHLDNVIIHSDTWQQHIRRVAGVLKSLKLAGLTANPKKCTIG